MTHRTPAAGRPRPGKLRVIGGRWRGRRIAIPAEPGLRPTTDRIRETLFNWLQPRISGARTLDLFAGTGILGLEALSRGAATVVFVERNPRLARALGDVLDALGGPAAEVIEADVYAWLARQAPRAFDIVFLDPPYGDDGHRRLCTLLAGGGWLADDALVYAECDRRADVPPPAGFRVFREKTAGNVRFMLLQPDQARARGEGQ